MQKFSLLAVALVATVAPSLAHADVFHHAVKCREAGSTVSGSFNFSEYRVSRSAAGGSGILLCPVDVDNAGSVDVSVNATDTMVGSALSCTLLIKNSVGDTLRYQTKSTVGSGGPQVLGFSLASTDMGSAVLSCAMPVNTSDTFTKLFGYVVQ